MLIRKYGISSSKTGCPSRQVEIYQKPKWTLGLETGTNDIPCSYDQIPPITYSVAVNYTWKDTVHLEDQGMKTLSMTS